MEVIEVLSPWDMVALGRSRVVPWTLSTGEVVAIDLDKVPEDDLKRKDKYQIWKYQGLDLSKANWLNSRVRPFVKCLGVKPLAGRKINFWTGELVTDKNYHVHLVKNKRNGYLKVNNILWHVAMEMEYQHRRFEQRFERIYDGEKGKYRVKDYEVHHRYQELKTTSFGNSLLSVSLVPKSYHRRMHAIMDRIAKKIVEDSSYRGAVVLETNRFVLNRFSQRIKKESQGEEIEMPKRGYFVRKRENVKQAG